MDENKVYTEEEVQEALNTIKDAIGAKSVIDISESLIKGIAFTASKQRLIEKLKLNIPDVNSATDIHVVFTLKGEGRFGAHVHIDNYLVDKDSSKADPLNALIEELSALKAKREQEG